MRYIELDTWPRRTHFEFFNTMHLPHFNLCANVDVTAFYPTVKRCGASFTVAMVYVTARAANAIPQFRQRIREHQIVEHEVVHPSTTILLANDLFTFCPFTYIEDFHAFAAHAAAQIAHIRHNPTLSDEPGQDDQLYMTAIPWITFTGVMHPLHLEPVDSVPRFAWGKYFSEGPRLKMPFSVQAHHGLMDGLHVGRYYATLQDLLDRPECFMKAG